MNWFLSFNPLFMFELLMAESMFVVSLKHRKGFTWKILVGIVVLFGISFCFPPDVKGVALQSFQFITLFASTLILGLACFDTPFKNIIFCGLIGFTIQHIASELYELFNSIVHIYTGKSFDFYSPTVLGQDNSGQSLYFFFLIYLCIFILVYGLSVWLLAPRIIQYDVFKMNTTSLLWMVGFLMLIDDIIGTVIINILPLKVLETLQSQTILVIEILLHGYNLLCCFLAIVLLIELPRRSQTEAELQTIVQLRDKEKNQYKVMKENMDIINIKCHDLKHQLHTLIDSDKDLASEEVEKIGNAVNIYQSAYQTDNDALNVVLMEKDMICKSKNISLSCIIDAAKLNFMKPYDIYALFGNIMDNAIEAVSKLDPDKRSIGLQINSKGNFLTITEYNGYQGTLNFRDGLPLTTKQSETYHGYGMKSIRYIVNQYKGNMRISTEKNIFELIVFFQLRQ